jgi:tetratricopeptide (TPR) repeat protein
LRGFGDGCSYVWCESHYGIAERSLYDQLALTLMLEQPAKMNSDWYESMLVKDPWNYRAMFGLGVLYHNKGLFKTALEIYKRLIGLRPNFDRPYEMMAFIYLETKDMKLA